MKNLFFVAVATGIFTGTSISSSAQTNVNLERLNAQNKHTVSLKFIDGIEITPDKVANDVALTTAEKNAFVASRPVVKQGAGAGTSIEQCSQLQFKYAMLVETEVESIANMPLYNFIEEWWGTHYRYGGSDKSGIDCSSFSGKLMLEVYKQNIPRTAREQYEVCEKVGRTDLKEGDFVFFNTRGGISHVGVYLGNDHFVHSSTSNGVTISSLNEDYYNAKFVSGGRISTSN